MAEKKHHAVALAYPMQGHVNPMLNLCKRLCSFEGISITLVNTKHNHQRLQESVSSIREQGFELELVAISDGLDPGEESAHQGRDDGGLQLSLIAAEKMREPFVELLGEIRKQGRRIDFIISDAYMGWSQEVAIELGIPRVALWSSSTAYALLNFQLPLLSARGFAPIRDPGILEDEEQRVDFIEGVPPLHPRDLPSIFQADPSPHDPGFEKRVGRARKLVNDAWVFVNSFEALEGEAIAAMRKLVPRFSPIGPLLPSAYLGLGTDLGFVSSDEQRSIEWLDRQAQASVVYISFGSLAEIGEAQLLELAKGIESSQEAFLWVVRGSSRYEWLSGFVERTRGRGLVVDWAPQLRVLFHPSVAAFMSHCGWNSVMESISTGVPILGFPALAEQNLNCKHAAVEWRICWRLARSKESGMVESGEITRLVSRFMNADRDQEGMELRIRAREMREMARGSVVEGGSSRKMLDEFVQALRNNNLG